MTAKSPTLAPNRYELSIFHLDYRAAREMLTLGSST